MPLVYLSRGAGGARRALAIADTDLVVAVWDRRLHAASQEAGLRVAPACLEP